MDATDIAAAVPGFVKFDAELVPGVAIIAVWPSTTVLPLDSYLMEIASQFGDPFKLSYWGEQHVGITLTQAVVAYDIYKAFYDATKNAPIIIAMDSSWLTETAITAETKKVEFARAFSEGLKALENGSIAGVGFPALGASWTKYLLYGAAGIGILYVGYRVFDYMRTHKVSRRSR